MYKGRREKPKTGQLCICRCPDWCEEGYQIATFDGEKFDYDAATNSFFDENVIAWLALNEDGEPIIE